MKRIPFDGLTGRVVMLTASPLIAGWPMLWVRHGARNGPRASWDMLTSWQKFVILCPLAAWPVVIAVAYEYPHIRLFRHPWLQYPAE